MNRSRLIIAAIIGLFLVLAGQAMTDTSSLAPEMAPNMTPAEPTENTPEVVSRDTGVDESVNTGVLATEAVSPQVTESDQPAQNTIAATATERVRVLGVVDGDTIDVERGGVRTRVRYIGINTPETVHPIRGAECFGKEASARNAALVSGQYVHLEKDVSETDKYGRLLRYVYLGDVLVNEKLVADGYANVSTYPPDVHYTDRFRAAEAAARAAGKGLWGADCTVHQSPSSEEGGAAVASEATTCTIKGNLAQETGERIYHVPGCPYYRQTVISEEKGERWFCTEDEALAAGWRKAQNCP